MNKKPAIPQDGGLFAIVVALQEAPVPPHKRHPATKSSVGRDLRVPPNPGIDPNQSRMNGTRHRPTS